MPSTPLVPFGAIGPIVLAAVAFAAIATIFGFAAVVVTAAAALVKSLRGGNERPAHTQRAGAHVSRQQEKEAVNATFFDD